MKDSQLLYTWGIIFFATCFLASGTAITGAWAVGIVCCVGGFIVRLQEKDAEKCRQELMSNHS